MGPAPRIATFLPGPTWKQSAGFIHQIYSAHTWDRLTASLVSSLDSSMTAVMVCRLRF